MKKAIILTLSLMALSAQAIEAQQNGSFLESLWSSLGGTPQDYQKLKDAFAQRTTTPSETTATQNQDWAARFKAWLEEQKQQATTTVNKTAQEAKTAAQEAQVSTDRFKDWLRAKVAEQTSQYGSLAQGTATNYADSLYERAKDYLLGRTTGPSRVIPQ